MNIRNNYNHTLRACYLGYIVQAIINNFAPLLFLTFQSEYNIPLSKIALLVTLNFGIQLLVDIICTKAVDKIGYRRCVLTSQFLASIGLICFGLLPDLLPNSYAGILISTVLYAVGSGLSEVTISPIVEACPTTKKEAAMSLLHSFYCWGHLFVVLASTAFFIIFGIENWKILSFIWAVLPLINTVYFSIVPIRHISQSGDNGDIPAVPASIMQIAKQRIFWLLIIVMICSGAAELSMSQWASAFAESALGISKTLGDLTGPCIFAALMGAARVLYAKLSDKVDLAKYMTVCSITCILSYLLAALSPIPILALVGCGLCGFSVGVMWPGAISLATRLCRNGGTTIFALLAVAGDIGCSAGPTIVGLISDAGTNSLKTGMLFATLFPLILLIALILLTKMKQDRS